MFRSDKPPVALRWRSHTLFILATVAVGLFTDLFLYGLVVPVLPFMLQDRVHIPHEQVQGYVSGLLAAYAGASVVSSLPAGWIADRTNARQLPFLAGLAALLGATILLAFGQTIAVLVVARILQGISGGVVWTVGLAMVLDTVGPQHLGKVIGSVCVLITRQSLSNLMYRSSPSSRSVSSQHLFSEAFSTRKLATPASSDWELACLQ